MTRAARDPREPREPRAPGRLRKACIVTSLTLLVALPGMLGLLLTRARLQTTIALGGTYYTVTGTPVTAVTLPAGTARVLLTNPTPRDAGQPSAANEIIRPGKSVRLGGYFYGLGEISKGDAVYYIGRHLDVFSLGMCGSTFTPADIQAIRVLNPRTRFYYMAFATTLFENASASNGAGALPPGTWGASHYPRVPFNATMHEWTVKTTTGTEACGVRRDAPDSSAHLMDLGSPAWADYFAWIYQNRAETYHADGVAVDEVMWRGYWHTDMAELRDYASVAEITETCYDWLARVDARTEMEVITQAFWDEAQQYQDGVWGEIAFKSGGQYGDRIVDEPSSIFYERMTWQQVVENAAAHATRDRAYIWAAWYERDDPGALEYAIATYLMAKPNNSTALAFHPQPVFDGGYPANLAGYAVSTVQAEIAAHPEFFDLELGAARGPMTRGEGQGGPYWRRDFEHGIVVVNPFRARLPGFDT